MVEPTTDAQPRSTRPRISVHPDGNRFVRRGEEWFPLFDTLWSVFTHVPEDEWERYVRQRAAQGFNAVNISILPILHDLSTLEGDDLSRFEWRRHASTSRQASASRPGSRSTRRGREWVPRPSRSRE